MPLQEELESQGSLLFRYRSHLPLIVLVLGVSVFVHTKLTGATLPMSEAMYEYICLAVCLLGLGIRVYTVGHTAQNTSGRNTSKGQVADQINSTGIYATVRHPLYVGNFFMWLGIAMLTQQFWFSVAFVFMYWVYYERIMFAEEQFLRKKFGQPYVDWASKTPAFIPAISQYRNPRLPFSWKKVFKKEKNGVVAVFLLIFLFRVLGQSLAAKTLVVPVDFWLYALAGSIVYYALMKIFKKSAFLRDEGR